MYSSRLITVISLHTYIIYRIIVPIKIKKQLIFSKSSFFIVFLCISKLCYADISFTGSIS